MIKAKYYMFIYKSCWNQQVQIDKPSYPAEKLMDKPWFNHDQRPGSSPVLDILWPLLKHGLTRYVNWNIATLGLYHGHKSLWNDHDMILICGMILKHCHFKANTGSSQSDMTIICLWSVEVILNPSGHGQNDFRSLPQIIDKWWSYQILRRLSCP